MKKVIIIPLLVLLLASFGCETKQKGHSDLTVGRSKLIDSGNALEAVGHLEKAEEEEVNKLEPRALLLIAYSYGISTGDADRSGEAAKFKSERSKRIEELTEAEMKSVLQVLNDRRSQVRRAGLQVLVDKGRDAAVLILDSLAKGRYPALHDDFTQWMLVDMGSKDKTSKVLDLILATLAKPIDETNETEVKRKLDIKSKLVRVLAKIGDAKAVDPLKSLHTETSEPGLAMEISTTLYQLGEDSYKNEIIAGVSHDDVAVRRAAAKAMGNIKGILTETLIAGLKDTDSEVVAALVEALAVHKDASAVDGLVGVLTSQLVPVTNDNGETIDPKRTAIDTLDIYGEEKLARGLASRITTLIIGGTVSAADNRLYLVQLLKREPFKKQIKAIKSIDDLAFKLYEYHEKKEENSLVKTTLEQLLDELQ